VQSATNVLNRTTANQDRKKIILTIVGVVVAIGVLLFSVLRGLVWAPISPNEDSRRVTAVDAVSGEVFAGYRLDMQESYPWRNTKTGERTLYPAELCYWTKDGKAKSEPTAVLLNDLVGKPGKTFCHDCGRQVVGRNPMPPPELMVEAYKARAGKK